LSKCVLIQYAPKIEKGINPLTPDTVEQISTGLFRFSTGLFKVIRSHWQIYGRIPGSVELQKSLPAPLQAAGLAARILKNIPIF
jgi:hypothetical protein